jgi:DNA repair exonuclease SbcCD nuclease subunit
MSKPYLLLSDTHYHAWDAFSKVTKTGVNSRLEIILEETERAFDTLCKAGGDTVIHAGDMFHTRGTLTPSVLNPVLDCYSNAGTSRRLSTFAIAGNHDLESNETRRLTAATSAVNIRFSDEARYVPECGALMINWHPKVDGLLQAIEEAAATVKTNQTDLIIHAPVDNVLPSIPSHGLTADRLAGLGFRRVFAGHYHNHKAFDGGVYSIGALTHQTWSDVGSKAGFLLVYPDRVEHHATRAPKFVDVPFEVIDADSVELMELCDGNYVRTTIKEPTAESEAWARSKLTEAGAEGILIRSVKPTSEMTHRRSETTDGIESLQEAVMNYARLKGGEKLAKVCNEIMTGV